MSSKKLNLNELRVKSFVTDFKEGKENTVKGGGDNTLVGCKPVESDGHPRTCPFETADHCWP